ncbi:hypothetical protein IM511_12100 [Erythrobacteraceae bacterium E2-1 Yellow Sea]|nr:hypothetical protein [Erythrobacteraceae bacterium E2-1 Yellow Sea]
MTSQRLVTLAAATLLAGTALVPAQPASAQIPALLPDKDTVEQTEAMEIDGDWRVNTINKVIRIERGRAYAVEGWTHAFLLKVQPDMVTIRNIRQVDAETYVGDDLPMMGQVTMKVVSPDRIEASVPGLFGPARYVLSRVAGSGNDIAEEAPFFAEVDDAGAPPSGPPSQPGNRPQFASLADAFGEPRAVAEAFRGCVVPDNARQDMSARAPQPSPRDRITGLEFAPVASADPNADVPDAGDACWTRLDGVWREDRTPTFDTSANDGSEWDVQGLPLAGLLHGNYTTPAALFIAPGDDPDNELYVMAGIDDVRMTRYVSNDGVSVDALIGRAGANKVFEAEEQTSLPQRLTLDYTAGGDLRIRLGNRQFLRPQTTASRDLPSDDVFAIQFQTDNFAANLKGYNVLTQDPFLLMNNNMREVFDRRDTDEYRIQEKYAVPFGFTLQNELLQGNVYRSTTVSSAKEMQDANSSSFGVKANISVSGAVNTALSFAPGDGRIADTGISVGNSSTQSSMNAMRQSNTVAQVVGYSRAKSYAIILDHSESKLSSGFLTAVGDAQREGRYQNLIDQFGTHYAYAVTYGASAKMTRDISSEAFESVLSETEGDKLEGEVRILGSSIGGFNESMNSRVEGYSGAFGNEGGRFIAVGGNGSWDSGGYSRGDRVAPILLDLRPLDELLNPINFPDQPDIYTRVRAELALAINQYLAGQARPLSNERLISKVSYTPPPPEPEPEPAVPVEEWHVYVRTIGCTKPGPGTTTGASGDIRISGSGHANAFAGSMELSTGCKWRDDLSRTYDYRISDNTPGLMILRGTREQLRSYTLNFDFNWRYTGATNGRTRADKRSLTSTPLQGSGLAVGKSHTTQWKFGPKGRPEITLHLRVKRIK